MRITIQTGLWQVYSVISNCVILFNSLFTGVGQSIQPIVATNYGAGKWERIEKVKRMAFLTIGVMGVRLYFIAFFPMGINLLTSYYLQSVLSVKKSLCISLLGNVILSSVAILVCPLLFGGNSLWLVMPVVRGARTVDQCDVVWPG